jgi:hypothetical protein
LRVSDRAGARRPLPAHLVIGQAKDSTERGFLQALARTRCCGPLKVYDDPVPALVPILGGLAD